MTPTNRLKIAFVTFSTALMTVFSGCGDAMTYADYQEEEDEAIEKFINDRHISIVGTMPETDGEWLTDSGKEVYYLYASGKSKGLYFHQIKKGEGDMVPQNNWTAYIRYVGYNMEGRMLYNCTAQYAPDPQSFRLCSDPSNSTFGIGFQEAVKNLRVGGKCKVIIPFDIGNSSNVTISGYSTTDAGEYRTMYYEIELVGLE